MGMTVKVEIVDRFAQGEDINQLFSYFHYIDEKFSPYKRDNEVEKINLGSLNPNEASIEMKKIIDLGEETKKMTNGYFDIFANERFDPSGIVKGYAIHKASEQLYSKGYRNYYVEIGGDIEAIGLNEGKKWSVGITNPFDPEKIIKVVHLSNKGIATSGNYVRGSHIHDPVANKKATDIASITVIGPDVYEADRFATAAFAMGERGVNFIENLDGFEAYMVGNDRRATYTSGFEEYTTN